MRKKLRGSVMVNSPRVVVSLPDFPVGWVVRRLRLFCNDLYSDSQAVFIVSLLSDPEKYFYMEKEREGSGDPLVEATFGAEPNLGSKFWSCDVSLDDLDYDGREGSLHILIESTGLPAEIQMVVQAWVHSD